MSVLYESLAEVARLLADHFGINLGIDFYDLYDLAYMLITPISDWLTDYQLIQTIPLLLIPIVIIFSGAFKFLSVTLITSRVKERGEILFLLISTAFVLIVTNILGYIYQEGIGEAPFKSIVAVADLLEDAVHTFAAVESLTFWGGVIFGFGWVFWRVILRRQPKVTPTTSATLQTFSASKEAEKVISRTKIMEDSSILVEDEEKKEELIDSEEEIDEEE
jgi:hypothetical protein